MCCCTQSTVSSLPASKYCLLVWEAERFTNATHWTLDETGHLRGSLLFARMLPENLVLHILSLLPPDQRAYAAKPLNRTYYREFREYTTIDATDPELPLWVVQQQFVDTAPEQQAKLFASRASVVSCLVLMLR